MPKLTRSLAIKAFDAIIESVDDLPDQPDVIAALLADLGVKGYRGHAGNCPISRYCQEPIKDLTARVRVGPVWLTFSWGRFEMSYEIPEGVKAFARRFDYGDYPQLVAHE